MGLFASAICGLIGTVSIGVAAVVAPTAIPAMVETTKIGMAAAAAVPSP